MISRRLVAVLLVATPAFGYLQRVINGARLHRPDYSQVQFFLNTGVTAGLNNANGNSFITGDSNPRAAIEAAMDAWNQAPDSAARFAPLGSTSAVNNSADNQNVIVFRDTPETRSALGDALAITMINYDVPSGTILDSDILFNPKFTFSTTLASGTYDLQSLATHELGHALGANHTGVLGAVMFQTTGQTNTQQRTLSSDDIAFAVSLYPAPTTAYGTLQGIATSNGSPLRGALLTAVDTGAGVVVGGLSDLSSGQFSFQVPPGNYVMYAEPLTGQVKPANLYLDSLSAGQAIDTAFQPAPAGGFGNPANYSVGPRATANVNFDEPAGSSGIQFVQTGAIPLSGTPIMIATGPVALPSGYDVEFLMNGPGIDSSLMEDNLVLLGPATINRGTLKTEFTSPLVMGVSIHVPARMTRGLASLLINKNGMTAAFSGGLILTPPPPVFSAASIGNAFSGSSGGVAPGEDISIYGTNLGPSQPSLGLFDLSTGFSKLLAGVSVTFDGVPAPLLYVSDVQINVQVPYEVAGKSSTNIAVSFNGSMSAAVPATVLSTHPGIFHVIVNQDGTFNSASNPAPRGSYPSIYALGLGQVDNQPATGRVALGSPLSHTLAPTTVTIGNENAPVYFSGLTPGSVGLGQVIPIIPADAPTGVALPVTVFVGGVPSQSGVNLYVK